ncbi:hypothetical protein ACLKA6_014827 [Drosophila palustris]
MTNETDMEQKAGTSANTHGQGAHGTSQIQASHEIFRVGVKPPSFCKEQPDLYFIQMESQFAVSGISTDATKYHQVIASLEPQYLVHIADIIRDPPQVNKYDAIKTALINEYTDSNQRKLNKLIHEVQLGDLKPSQLLKRMKDLAGTQISDEAIKSLWLERLPENVRAIVSIVDGDSAKVSLQADKVLESQRHSTVCALQENVSDAKLRTEIDELRKELRKLKSGSASKNQSRNSKSPDRSTFCYYHGRFGAKARRCTEPCDFKKLNPEN